MTIAKKHEVLTYLLITGVLIISLIFLFAAQNLFVDRKGEIFFIVFLVVMVALMLGIFIYFITRQHTVQKEIHEDTKTLLKHQDDLHSFLNDVSKEALETSLDLDTKEVDLKTNEPKKQNNAKSTVAEKDTATTFSKSLHESLDLSPKKAKITKNMLVAAAKKHKSRFQKEYERHRAQKVITAFSRMHSKGLHEPFVTLHQHIERHLSTRETSLSKLAKMNKNAGKK